MKESGSLSKPLGLVLGAILATACTTSFLHGQQSQPATAPSQGVPSPSAIPPDLPWLKGTAKVQSIRYGRAWRSTDGVNWKQLTIGDTLSSGSIVETDAKGVVDLFLRQNGPVVRVTPDTSLVLRLLRFAQTEGDAVIVTEMHLLKGRVLGHVKKLNPLSRYEVTTPKGTRMRVAGTQYDITSIGRITVAQGSVTVTSVSADGTEQTHEVREGYTFELASDSGGPRIYLTPPAEAEAAMISDSMRIVLQGEPSGPPGGAWALPPRSDRLEQSSSGGGGSGFSLFSRSRRQASEGFERQGEGPPDEELWIIARPKGRSSGPSKDSPGCGCLLAREGTNEKQVPVPLKQTQVKASVQGVVAAVEVGQWFHNPFPKKIEATYVFPLPENAAVNEFLMTIGQRRIRGIIRERQEAEQIYSEAKSQGYVASLLTQERPNVFTQAVANIEPGKDIHVQITYFNTLAQDDGWYELVFPMVVGPRFNPPGSTRGVGAAARGHAGVTGQPTEVQYLKPNERTGHTIALRVDIDAGATIEEFKCPTHAVTHDSPTPEKLTVALAPRDKLPNKDFVLRYRVAGKVLKSSLFTHQDERGGFLLLNLFPPKALDDVARSPMEMIFVLDSSGSMSGHPIRQAKQAIRRGLKHLTPDDTFQIINFSDTASQLGSDPIRATPENIRRGDEYVDQLAAGGGTMMINGIKASLAFHHDPERLRFVCFLTDGYIGNETEILGAVRQHLGSSRIFSFGVGTSVNRYLLDSLAKLGAGAAAYLGPHDGANDVMDRFFNRVSHPALTDIKVDWGDLRVSEVFPRHIPDVFVGRPLLLAARFDQPTNATVRVSGKVDEQTREFSLQVRFDKNEPARPALPSVWARMKLADLAQRSVSNSDTSLPRKIKQVALDYSLMSAYTAFVAVDASKRTDGSLTENVPVPVPVPEGVKYETTVTR